MFKNKMTLFVVILFGFTTAFSMQKPDPEIEAAKAYLKLNAKFAELYINNLPDCFPDKQQIVKAFDDYSQGINKVNIDETQCLQKLCVVQDKLVKGMDKIALVTAFVLHLNNQNKKN